MRDIKANFAAALATLCDSRTKVRRAQKIFINLSDARDILIMCMKSLYRGSAHPADFDTINNDLP